MAKDTDPVYGRALDLLSQWFSAKGGQGSVSGVLDVVWAAKGGDAGIGQLFVELLDNPAVTPTKKLDATETLLELRAGEEARRAKDPKPAIEMGDMADMAAALQIILKNANAAENQSTEIRTADEPGGSVQADPSLGTADDT